MLTEDADLLHAGEFNGAPIIKSISDKYCIIPMPKRESEIERDLQLLERSAEEMYEHNDALANILHVLRGYLMGSKEHIINGLPLDT